MTIETTTREIFGNDLSTTEEWRVTLNSMRVPKKKVTHDPPQIEEIITSLDAYCANRTVDKRVFSNMLFRNRARSVHKNRYQFASFADTLYTHYRGEVPQYLAYACNARNWYMELRKRIGAIVKGDDSNEVHRQVCKLVSYYEVVEN